MQVDSRTLLQKERPPIGWLFLLERKGIEHLDPIVRGTIGREGLTERHIYFFPSFKKRKNAGRFPYPIVYKFGLQ